MEPMNESRDIPEDEVLAHTRQWLEKAVIGLNLCPFAKAEHVHGRIHYRVSQARDGEQLLIELGEELQRLLDTPADQIETSLLIHPMVFQDFLDFNDFIGDVDDLIERLGLAGILQVASFHPRFQFADTAEDDIGNFTNRAPYPTLHLLREDSIDRAVQAFPEADEIFERNILTMKALGHRGWQTLFDAVSEGSAARKEPDKP